MTNADKILARLEKLRETSFEVRDGYSNVLEADVVIGSDLDAAIAEIRKLCAEPVKCQRCSGLGRILSMTGPYAEEVCRVCDGTGRYPDAQGGTDAK